MSQATPMLGILNERKREQLLRRVARIMPKKPVDKRERVLRTLEEIDGLGFWVSPQNTKLGAIMNFSLPAGQWKREGTCPGATKLCEKICYAMKGRILLREYNSWANWAYIQLWPDRFVETLIRTKLSPVFRIHVGGDFLDPAYVTNIWMPIIRAKPNTRFFAYTRSWQDGRGNIAREFIEPLTQFAQMPNARLVLSIDHETGVPPMDLIPGSIRAWLAVSDKDMPPEPVELIFRHRRPSTLNRYPRDSTSQENGTPVCPYERKKRQRGKEAKKLKKGAVICQNCIWCWGGAHQAYGVREDDLSKFDMWSGVRDTIDIRLNDMFTEFMPGAGSPSMRGPAVETSPCVCGAVVPCTLCGVCMWCLCECP